MCSFRWCSRASRCVTRGPRPPVEEPGHRVPALPGLAVEPSTAAPGARFLPGLGGRPGLPQRRPAGPARGYYGGVRRTYAPSGSGPLLVGIARSLLVGLGRLGDAGGPHALEADPLVHPGDRVVLGGEEHRVGATFAGVGDEGGGDGCPDALTARLSVP